MKSGAALSSAPVELAELTAKMPLRFEANVGQLREAGVRYFARGSGYRLFLDERDAVLQLGTAGGAAGEVRLRLTGGAEHPAVVGIDPLPTRSNYFIGNDPRAWHTGVASFAGVRYEKVYPGTDLVFSGNDRRVEQSFYLAAGASPRLIRMVYEGATAATVAPTGELVLATPGGELRAERPVAYQRIDGERRPVACRYELSAQGKKGAPEVRFLLGSYDRKLPLVIDPIFDHSTLLGGGDYDLGTSVAVDGSGNVYVAGSTTSTNFIGTVSPGGVQPVNGGPAGNSWDGFVAKIDPTGSTLLYATYLGGSGVEEIHGMAVDAAGNAYLTGYTFSTDFPGVTAASLQSSNAGARDAFVVKLNPTGSAFVYSTYLGGSGSEFGNGIAIDASGNAYVTGYTGSTDFPGVAPSALQPGNAGGNDAFVAKINPTGSAIVYATYLGGSGDDQANHIALDSAGDAFVAGGTCSTNFPVTAGALQTASSGVDCSASYDAFVAKLNPSGTALLYSTYLGGSDNDIAQGVAVDAAGNAYVTGFTRSTAFTGVTAGSFQPTNPGGYAAFLTKVNAAGSATGYSTFLGGGSTFGYAVAVDSGANAYVTGTTFSGYPIVNAASLQPTLAGNSDGFVTKVAGTGAVLYSTFMGGSGDDAGYGIAVDSTRNAVYVTGSSTSSNLPGVGAGSIQSANAGGPSDAFLVRIVPGADLTIGKTANVTMVDPGGRITYTLTYHNLGDVAATGATLTETVPANTVFQSALSTAGWSCTPNTSAGSTCTLTLGTVAAGGSGSATFVVQVAATLPAGAGPIHNTACVHPGSNCSTVDTPTTAAPVLSLTKTANSGQAKPGSALRYTIHYANTGNEDAANLVVTDTVPSGTVFDPTDSSPGWSCVPDGSAGSVCTFTLGTLAAGASGSVSFAVTYDAMLSNTACLQTASGGGEAPTRTALPACSTATVPIK